MGTPRSTATLLAWACSSDPPGFWQIHHIAYVPRRPLFTQVRGETVWKSERGRSMTYAAGHGKALFDRSLGCRVGMPRASRPTSRQARTTEDPHHPRDPRCDLLRPKERLPLAALAP